jgi:hypothetical protein
MSTADHCRAMADEADRLASIVSYARDKMRLKEQADSWRAKAAALEATPVAACSPEAPANGLFTWLRRRAG